MYAFNRSRKIDRRIGFESKIAKPYIFASANMKTIAGRYIAVAVIVMAYYYRTVSVYHKVFAVRYIQAALNIIFSPWQPAHAAVRRILNFFLYICG